MDKDKDIKLPWREWHQHSKCLGALEADKGSAVAVLHGLHGNFSFGSEKIEVGHNASSKHWNFVVAAEDVEAETICLPPCVPKHSKVLIASEHPYAVKMEATVTRPPTEQQ